MKLIYLLEYSFLIQIVRSELKISIPITPNSTQNKFSLSVYCSDEDAEITLSSLPLGLEGDLKSLLISNHATFNNLRFKSQGSFQINATSSHQNSSELISSSYSESIPIVKAIENILIFFPNTVMSQTNIPLSVEIMDQFNINWSDSVELMISSSELSSSVIAESGTYTGNWNFLYSGNYKLQVRDKITGLNTFVNVKVKQKQLKIITSFESRIYLSDEMVNLKVSTGSMENVEVSISLECAYSGCSGVRTSPPDLKKTGSLTVISDFFKIISSGTFRVVANAYGYDSAYSTQVITVKNKVHRIESKFHINSAPCFTDAILTTKIYGEDDNLYVDYINLTYYRSFLNEKSRFQVITNKGQFQKTVYLTEVGYFYYKIYHNVTQDYNHLDINQGIHVYPNYIEIDRDEDSFPSNTRESFKFKIRITDNLYSNLIPKKPLNFFITVDPSTKLKGKSKKFTLKNGEATINDLIIPKSGSFQLQINCSTCINYTSESFNITRASCMIKAGPLSCLSILTFFMFFSLIFFSLSDRKILKDEEFEYSGFWRKFIKIYPLTGLLIKQPKNQRILISLQFFSSEIFIFALIGAFCAYFDSSLERHEKSFIDCYQVQINKGAVGWTLAQVFIVPAFFLRFYAFGDRRLRVFSAAFDVFIAIVAGGVIFLVFFEFCITFSEYWTWNFVIFSVLDVSLMQSFYSFIALSIIHKKESKFLVYHENAEDFTDLQFSERDVKEEFKTFSQVDTGKQKKSNKNDFDGERIDHVV